jgi:hypothetical protein
MSNPAKKVRRMKRELGSLGIWPAPRADVTVVSTYDYRRPEAGAKVKSLGRWIALFPMLELLQLLFEGDAWIVIVDPRRKPDIIEGERRPAKPSHVG